MKDSVIPQKAESYSKRGEVMRNEDMNKSTAKKTSRSSNERKPQQIHDLNTNGESRVTQINKNNRSDRVSQKQERQTNGDLKEKLHTKRRSPEVVENPQVERTKTVRTEKSNEIKIVARSKQIQEPERRVQKSKQDSQQVKPVKSMNSVSKESKPQPVEANQKAKDPTPKAQEPEPTQQKMAPVARRKVDSIAVARTESPRTNEEVLRRRNRTINNLSTPLKHKLSVLKETNRNEVRARSEPKEIIIRKVNLISSVNKTESTNRSRDIVHVCENETKRDPQITSEIVVAGTNEGTNIKKADLISNANKTELANRVLDIVSLLKLLC
ncbi:uncharacterized protein LOC143584129 [Bidens hawaiensis]|uniref:uncharacterized protein LOC143584129 n=1 Tax=Bidens hawaiensis TaxID=980011 RepID=UPI00404B7CDE